MHPPDDPDHAAGYDATVRLGAVLVLVGTVASAVTLLPLALGVDAFPVAIYLLCFLAPLGLGVVLVALWRRARSRSARIRFVRDGDAE
jgi:hypothetical protein